MTLGVDGAVVKYVMVAAIAIWYWIICM